MQNILRLLLFLIAPFLLASCFYSYKYDVQQGNIVDQERLSKVERGMSKRDVQVLLGTPLIQDIFHANRWDYYYFLKHGRSKETETRLITLYFKDDKLDRITGDVTGGEGNGKNIDGIKVIKIEGRKKEGFLERTLDDLWKKDKEKAD